MLFCNDMRGRSGRIVIEVDRHIKQRLHAKLAANDRTLKEWFLEAAGRYLEDDDSVQLTLKGLTEANRQDRNR